MTDHGTLMNRPGGRRRGDLTRLLLSVAALLAVTLPVGAWSAATRPNQPALAAEVAPSSLTGSALTIASLNMARKHQFEEVSGEILHLASQHDVSVLFLQEVQQDAGDPQVIAEQLAGALHFHCVFETTDYWDDGGSQGLAILSRDPVSDVEVIPLKHFDLRFHQRNRIALAATVLTPRGPVRIINAHFDTRINTDERLEQVAGVLRSAAHFAGLTIIGGDFNTGDFRWLTRWFPVPFAARQQDAVRQTFEGQGFETPFGSTGATFKHLGLKLDWIFSRGLHPVAWGIDDIRFSDHRAIWVSVS